MQNACHEWMYRELMDERDFSSSVCDLTTSSSFSRLGLQWYVQSRYEWWMKKDMTEGWCKMDEKTDGRQRGMLNAGIWRRIMNGYIENPWTKVSFIHLLMSLGHLYSARLQQEAWWMKRRPMKEGWCNRDEKWMPTGDPEWTVSQDERKNTSRLDGRKRYLFIRCRPVRTKACAWETGTSGVFLHFARVVKSAASRENRASFRCDIVVVQWNSSRLFSLMIFFSGIMEVLVSF
jgi:hypothetical protein